MTGSTAWFQIDRFSDPGRGLAPVDVRYGPGRTAELGDYAGERGRHRVLLVTGANVAADSNVMGPVREALGARVVGEFLEATPAKSAATMYAGVERMIECGADLVLGIGGGATLVTARQISALAADGRPLSELQSLVLGGGSLRLRHTAAPTDVLLLPTTLAGADLSTGGSFELVPGGSAPDARPRVVNPQTVGAAAVFYDPRAFESTPGPVLAGSAVNGLNKAVESVYSPRATLLSDTLAARGVELMCRGLLRLADDRRSGLELAVAGVVFAQLKRDISVLHAFGHAVARHAGVQQGVAHAIVTPHVLRLLLSLVDLRRDVLAAAMRRAGATDEPDDATAVLAAVVAVRTALGLPARLAEVGARTTDLAGCVDDVRADPLMAGSPLERPLAAAEVQDVLVAAA